jgi:L-alanine-DL-glutamate epimerase-like enolase superfamily enzyme
MPHHTISAVAFWPVDIPLTDPFVVATGARVVAENVFVRMTLADGRHGYGEAAPFPEVGGENRASCLASLARLAPTLIGKSIKDYGALAHHLAELAPAQPAARCGLETALLDAYCRAEGIPMWRLWGGADVRARETDMTIPITTRENTVRLARGWYQRGFRLFKMKVGKDVVEDISRLEAVHKTLPGVSFIGDGNQGFTRKDCLRFAQGVTQFGGNMVLLEQPVVREDLDSLAAIRRDTGVPVAADESVRSLDDARRVVEQQAADYINIKIMKTGVLEAAEISLVLGMKGFEVLDLDTPLLLARDPVQGGYRYQGPHLQPWQEPGLAMEVPGDPAARSFG